MVPTSVTKTPGLSPFVNLPSKFISGDGRTAWLCYSGNFATDWNNEKTKVNPAGTRYGLVLQKIRLLGPATPLALAFGSLPVPWVDALFFVFHPACAGFGSFAVRIQR